MQRHYLEAYGTLERDHWWFAGRRAILLRLLHHASLPARPLVLNVGSATGASSQWLAEIGDVRSVELDPQTVRWSVEAGLRDVATGSILRLPFREATFDLVAALDVIEHVEDDMRAVRELARAARPGGLVLVTVPALAWLWSRHDVVNRHCRRYSARPLLELLDGAGLELLRWSYFNSLLLPLLVAVRLADRAVGLERLRGPSGSDLEMTGGRLSSALGRLALQAEARLLPTIRLPLGASLVALARRPGRGESELP